MVADGLTKPLSIQQHNSFLKMINMVNVEARITPDLSPTLGGPSPSIPPEDDEATS